jgi:hypothetical protein
MPLLACEAFSTVEEVLDAACACDLNEGDHGDLIEEYIDDAADILYVLSGGRVFGRCTRTVRPFRDVMFCGPRPIWGYSYGYAETWVDWDGVDSIPLQGPETEIVEIVIDGAVIDPADYGLLNGNKLFRRSDNWPNTNDVTLADTEEGTWSIEYRFGSAPTATTKRASNELICQMVKGDRQTLSRLRGIVSANVQGVSVTMDDNEVDSLGLPEVSRFMNVYGNNGLGPFGVWAPETNHGWHLVSVTGGSGS